MTESEVKSYIGEAFQEFSNSIVKTDFDGSWDVSSSAEDVSNRIYNEIQEAKKKELKTGDLSNHRACQIVANEGIGYAVQSYIAASEFKDPETVRLWNEAEKALEALQEHIGYDDFEE